MPSAERFPPAVAETEQSREAEARVWANKIIALLNREDPNCDPVKARKPAERARRETRREAQRAILKQTYHNNFEETVREDIKRQHTWRREHDEPQLTEEGIARLARGSAFEQLAIASLPKEEHQYPELEKFILDALKDPELWRAAFYNADFLTMEESQLYEKYMEVRPREDELYALRNNDAISVRIKEDEKTGKPVALITGVVEAKNYQLTGGDRAAAQAAQAPEILAGVVGRFKEVFPLLVRYLGLSGELPENIDVVGTEKLSYLIVQPENVKGPKPGVKEEYYPHCKFQKIPFTKEEAAVIAGTVVPTARFNKG